MLLCLHPLKKTPNLFLQVSYTRTDASNFRPVLISAMRNMIIMHSRHVRIKRRAPLSVMTSQLGSICKSSCQATDVRKTSWRCESKIFTRLHNRKWNDWIYLQNQNRRRGISVTMRETDFRYGSHCLCTLNSPCFQFQGDPLHCVQRSYANRWVVKKLKLGVLGYMYILENYYE